MVKAQRYNYGGDVKTISSRTPRADLPRGSTMSSPLDFSLLCSGINAARVPTSVWWGRA